MPTIERSLADTIEQLERDLGLTPNEFASALGVSSRTVERWRKGEALPQREPRQRLSDLLALNHHLHETFVASSISGWLRTDNRYLGGLTPADAIKVGRFDRIEGALEVIDSGIFL